MAKKRKEPNLSELVAELKCDFDRYEHYLHFGGSDPNYADGVNMNLIRNHIIYDKEKIQKYCKANSCDLPKEYFVDTPDVVPNEFMANPEEIRKGARIAVDKLKPYYDKLYQESKLLTSKQKEDNNIISVLGYYTRLLSAINNDDLVIMRLYKNRQNNSNNQDGIAKNYVEAFVSKLEKIKTLESETVQLSLF